MEYQVTATHTAEQPKFCKDCRHARRRDERYPTCAATETLAINLVHGYQNIYCRDARSDKRPCGPAGKLFVLQNIKSADSLAKSIPDVETCKERIEQFMAIIRSPEYIAMTSNRLFGDLDGSVTCDSAAEQTLSPSAPASDGLSDRTAD